MAYLPIEEVKKSWTIKDEDTRDLIENTLFVHNRVKEAIHKLQRMNSDKVHAEPFHFFTSGVGADAFVFCNESYLVIAFRGTELNGAADIISDLSIGKAKLKNSHTDVFVHSGFQEQYLSIRLGIREQCRLYIEEFGPTEIVITGHSLGGSLAMLCALDLKLLPVMPSKERLNHHIFKKVLSSPARIVTESSWRLKLKL